jgi:hypothetical protein
MLRSADHIRTTHVGSPARPPALLDLMRAAAQGRPVDEALAESARRATARLWRAPPLVSTAIWLQGPTPTMAADHKQPGGRHATVIRTGDR